MNNNEDMIIADCFMLGIKLPDIEYVNIPRFSLPLNKINYAALISRAYYYYKKDYVLKEKKKKKSKDLKGGAGEEAPIKHMKTGIQFGPDTFKNSLKDSMSPTGIKEANKTQQVQTKKKLLLSKTMNLKSADEIEDELDDDEIEFNVPMQDTKRSKNEMSSSRKKDNQ